ncbi:MAG TPA: Asp-tRNA(Asn)/Glu-tRNA(Gln) amidotransferase subunit GatC [Elusimicrobiales bacterium]|nr:Asp-tRNA(Asn)/Glu-tRNA(Gln) amidotransferase subunit GatC [Elusimicrobiales bacterium]
MAIDLKEVEHIAKLALLEIDAGEKQKLTEQLKKILSWMERLNEVNTKNVEPALSAANFKTLLREDTFINSDTAKDILANVPMREYNFVKVKKVINDE